MAPSLLFDQADRRPLSPAYDQPSPVSLEGFCSINGSPDVACSMVALSLDRATLMSSASVAFCDGVTLSMPHIGLQKGVVARVFDGGFEVSLARASHERLATYLDWIVGAAGSGHEMRRYERIVPIRKLVMLHRSKEPPSLVRIVDLSRSGAAFTTTRALALGEEVTIGRKNSRIVRLFEGGAAALFDEVIAEPSFNAMIDLSA